MTGRHATAAGIVAQAVRGSRVIPAGSLAACGVLLSLLASGCGEARRDAREPKGLFTVEGVKARFPAKQAIAHDTALALVVRNAGVSTIPDVAVTLDSLSYASTYPNLAANKRPVWIVNTGPGPVPARPVETAAVNPPGGSDTAFVNTWALGAGAVERFVWRVTPVRTGVHTVHFAVAAGLDGKARAQLAGGTLKGTPKGRTPHRGGQAAGGPAVGQFTVQVAPAPPRTNVNPRTGRVVAGAPPVSSGPVPAVP